MSGLAPLCSARLLRSMVAFATLLLATTVGCGRGKSRNQPQPPSMAGHGSASGSVSSKQADSLLQSVISELDNLAERSIVTLKLPVVRLDAARSSDGQEVLAQLTKGSDGLYNLLVVPARNSRFRQQTEPSDTVEFYGVVTSELSEEFGKPMQRLSPKQQQLLRKLPEEERQKVAESMLRDLQVQGEHISTRAIDLTVAEVINDNTLRVEPFDPHLLSSNVLEVPVRIKILRYDDARFRELRGVLARYAAGTVGVARLGWEPSPDKKSLDQIVEHLNQWLRQSKEPIDWHLPKLLATLPDELQNAEPLQLFISNQALQRGAFSLPTEEQRATQAIAYEGRLLQEATWMRDISLWVGEGEYQTLPRVEKVFDWTIRSLQLDSLQPDQDGSPRPAYRPWQSVMHAHATAEGRAWVFAQICRQLHVPVVIIRPAATSEDLADASADSTPANGHWWCGAVVGEAIYLFDPTLGLPLPGPGDSPATLTQIRENPKLLRQFDLPDAPYPWDEASLRSITFEVIAGPFSLTRRAALLERNLTGDSALVLQADVDALENRLQELASPAEITLWDYPYRILLAQVAQLTHRLVQETATEFEPFVYQPRLWKARLLHFRGHEGIERDASRANIETEVNDHRDAGRLYTHKSVRPPTSLIARQPSTDTQVAWTKAKENATYWVGLLCIDRHQPKVAIDPWLKLSEKSDTWRQGASYNHARALEQLGETQQAIDLLEAETSQQPLGSSVRAKLLRVDAIATPNA